MEVKRPLCYGVHLLTPVNRMNRMNLLNLNVPHGNCCYNFSLYIYIFFFSYTVVPLSRMQFTSIRPRKRRHVLNETSVSITIHDVRREIVRQFEQLIPIKYCKSSEKICPTGPPGLPGTTGSKGPRGKRGPKGKKGSQGRMGPPGKSGKTGITGLAGPRGGKGDKGETKPKGMPGPPGLPIK